MFLNVFLTNGSSMILNDSRRRIKWHWIVGNDSNLAKMVMQHGMCVFLLF